MLRLLVIGFALTLAGCSADSKPPAPAKADATPPPEAKKGGKTMD